jgi:hypothetical protein
MIVHQVYAQICDKEIKNVIVCDNYDMANWLTRASYGERAFAVDCLQYSCQAKDKYRDGIFYRVDDNGIETVINPVMSTDQEIASINAQIAYLQMMSGINEGV